MSKISNFFNAIRNFKNAWEYNINKTKRKYRTLNFVTKPFAINLKVDKESFHVFKEIFIEDFYNYRKIEKYIPKEPLIVDIGGNIGFFSFFILSKKPKSKILIYEPFQENIKLIHHTIEQNTQIKNNINIFPNAVTETNKEIIALYVSDNIQQTAVASIYDNFDNRNSKKIEVETINIEAIFKENNLEQIDVLKLDCEGAEYPILYKTDPIILMKINLILIEVHHLKNETYNNESLIEYLKNIGFIIHSKIYSNNCYYTIAINPKNV